MTRRGVIYIATGGAHIEAARRSAASVRRHNPDLSIAVFSDEAHPGPEFDIVEPVAGAHARSKLDYMPESPFAETLYLDTDTRVLGGLADMFRLLERFDLAAAHRVRDTARVLRPTEPDVVPSSFPEHNGGVILYRARPEVTAFLRQWQETFRAVGKSADQISFRQTLWASDLRVAVLPPRFNTRRYTWADKWFSSRPDPVILHLNRFHPTKRSRFEWLIGPDA